MPIPNLNNYTTQKEKKLVSFQKIEANKTYAYVVKKYSEVDGSELPSFVQGITIIEINNQIAEHQAEIDKLNTLKTDILATI